ncbi:hypothetical protein [Luteitalea sp.]
MTRTPTVLTLTDMIAASSQVLTAAGYRQMAAPSTRWDSATSRLFEDEYNVVGVVVFGTCGELLQSWPDLQGSLVELISKHVSKGEAKSWDGYLVLLTSGVAPSEEAEIRAVRYDTARVRKIVATGEDLATVTDVGRVLRPLLPLSIDQTAMDNASALDVLPRLLAAEGIAQDTTRILIEAFREQSPLIERLHEKEIRQ